MELTDFSNGIQFTGHTGEVLQASFSPDGKLVVTASYDAPLVYGMP
jgi:WD40 repeat protein